MKILGKPIIYHVRKQRVSLYLTVSFIPKMGNTRCLSNTNQKSYITSRAAHKNYHLVPDVREFSAEFLGKCTLLLQQFRHNFCFWWSVLCMYCHKFCTDFFKNCITFHDFFVPHVISVMQTVSNTTIMHISE